ncbi:Macro domain, ADP-ribose binding module [Desulfurella amilsii]|uniref:Macro domain, ADP-ribose binding module n=1 Tax=Desulfurella amilsii TaxID=1562698 RepID=A0A1X4XUY7_9BACT|nr:macro domain-containing protein [Desulfurella amilsii]OSS41328.1 Macro domain, ADP-ribose binding module [Desulfurella amilsii]
MELYTISLKNKIIKVILGDIIQEATDAIVNPANNYLKHGGGVAYAIVSKGGLIIQQESDKIGYVETGHSAITTGGKLKAKYVIHTVGPVWQDGKNKEEKLLKNAVISALDLAQKYRLNSIALPSVSTGIFGFPKELGVKIIVNSVIEFIKVHDLPKEIHFTNIDEYTSNLFASYLKVLNVD